MSSLPKAEVEPETIASEPIGPLLPADLKRLAREKKQRDAEDARTRRQQILEARQRAGEAARERKQRLLADKQFLAILPRDGRAGARQSQVKSSYEVIWGAHIDRVRDKLGAGESLAHLLKKMRRGGTMKMGYNAVGGALAKDYLDDRGQSFDKDDMPLLRLSCAGGRFYAVQNFRPMRAIQLLAARANIIVELGAGPGWNLFELSIELGKAVATKRIFALEYTEAGVDVINEIAAHEDLPISAYPFDYLSPDLSMVPDDASTLIFSHHSIEQVEDISDDLYRKILARRSPTTLVHCEPIGWQRFPDLLGIRTRNDLSEIRALADQRRNDLSGPRAVPVNAALNSWRTGYNRNAFGLITSFAEHERVSVVRQLFDFNHENNANPVNPSSYIELCIAADGAAAARQSARDCRSDDRGDLPTR